MRTPITNSSMQTFMRCEELYRLKYVENLRPMTDPSYLNLGSGFHEGMEHRSADSAEAYLRASVTPWKKAEEDELEFDVGTVRAMVIGALARWTDYPSTREMGFRLSLRHPVTGGTSKRHTLNGVLDGLYPLRAMGEEYKTAARVNNDYMDRLDLDFQVSTYCEAASLTLGKSVRKFRYRVVQKPTIKPHVGETEWQHSERVRSRKPLPPLKQRKTETDYEYRQRSEEREANRAPLKRKVPETTSEWSERVLAYYTTDDGSDERYVETMVERTEQQMERWRHEAWAIHERIMAVERGGMTIRNTSSCIAYNTRCAFLDLCCGAVGTDAYRVVGESHPELATAG